MDNTFEKYERIEAYLSGNLSGKDLEVFEMEMKSDPKLAEEVAMQQEVFEAVKDKEARAFRKTLEDIRDKRARNISAVRKKSISLGRILAIAASILVIAVAGIWLWNTGQTSAVSPYQLSVNNFEKPARITSSYSTARGNQPNTEELDIWTEVEDLYQADQLLGAYEKLASVSTEFYNDYADEINYKMAVIALALDKSELVLEHLEKIVDSHSDSKIWLKALALLRLDGQLPQAKTILEEIANSNHPKKEQAIQMLKRIN
jgi:tetratricopeptide (TPR) repeat protein